jgi:predicted SpoU family rRNA methylase
MKYVIIILALAFSHSTHAQPITTPADFGEIDRDFKFPAPRQTEGEVRPYEKIKRDRTLENIISDPRVVFSTYFGGNGYDCGYGLTSDSQGNIYWVGYTGSTNIPIVGNAYQTEKKGGHDALIAKFSPDGQPVWITYFGGNATDVAMDCSMDSEDNLIVTGATTSADFPVTFGEFKASTDAFISKFDSDGNLLWSRCFGGSAVEVSQGIDKTSKDEIVIAGYTNSLDLPKKGDVFCDTLTYFDSQYTSILLDCFVTKFDKNGGLIWNTYFGRQADEQATACAVDPMDNIAVCGKFVNAGNYRTKFPTSDDAFQPDSGGKEDGIVFMLTPDGQRKWATYFGGSNKEYIKDITIDDSGEIYFCGYTESYDLSVSPGAFQSEKQGGGAGIIARFDNSGQRIWATYFGGSVSENLYVLDVSADMIALSGFSASDDFPIGHNPIHEKEKGRLRNFISIFDIHGKFIWSTIYRSQLPFGLEISTNDQITYTGYTEALEYPVTENAFQKKNPSGYEPPYPSSSMLTSFKFSLLSVGESDNELEFALYPNPCVNTVIITSQSKSNFKINSLYNSIGCLVDYQANIISSNEIMLNFNLPNGCYYIDLSDGENRRVLPFIVNK